MVVIKCDFCGITEKVNANFSTFVGIEEKGWIEFKRTGGNAIEHACPVCTAKIGSDLK